MKYSMMMLCAFSVAVCAFAEEVKTEADKEARKEAFLMRTGGRIARPGSLKGMIAVIDTQKKVASTNFAAVVRDLVGVTKLDVRYFAKEPGCPEQLRTDCKADLAVIVVDDEKAPTSLVALEDRWATVNVAKLGAGLATDEAKVKFRDSRARKELYRVFSLLCGGGSSQFKGTLMNCATFNEMDVCNEYMPMDVIGCAKEYLQKFGVEPEVTAAYSQACREGWAPQPTNKYQKAAWDRIHALPTKPIKIVPESQRKAK